MIIYAVLQALRAISVYKRIKTRSRIVGGTERASEIEDDSILMVNWKMYEKRVTERVFSVPVALPFSFDGTSPVEESPRRRLERPRPALSVAN